MKLNIYKDHNSLSLQTANEVFNWVRHKPASVLCLAAGDTPRNAYSLLAETASSQGVDFSRCTFIGLDEWVGVPPENEGSCHCFLQQEVFQPLQISPHQIHLFNSMNQDLLHECEAMDEIISAKGGIDFMIVGIGMNGHIGFNEPGVPFNRFCHVVDLDENTRSVGQKYFKAQTSLTKGITLGLSHLMQAKKVILMANGSRKAGIIQKALEGEITPHLPASIIRNHPNAMVMLDEEAASALTKIQTG